MLELFETDTWEIKKTIPIGTNRGVHVQFLPDNRHVAIASAGTDGSVGIADMPSGRVHLLGKQSVAAAPGAFGPGGITSFAVSPDGRLIATGGYTNAPTLWLWDTETGESRSLKHPAGRLGVSALAFSPDGREVVSSVVYDDDGKGAHIVWNLSTSYGSAP
jgi:WD40 repeat protein